MLNSDDLYTFHLYGFRRGNTNSRFSMIVDASTEEEAIETAKDMSGNDYVYDFIVPLGCPVNDNAKCRHLSNEELRKLAPELMFAD